MPVSRCGRYRKVQNYIVNSRNAVIFTPPAPQKIKQRIKELFDWVEKHQKDHPIVRSAIFHHEFVTIHPFIDGNGRVARAASQWLIFNQRKENDVDSKAGGIIEAAFSGWCDGFFGNY